MKTEKERSAITLQMFSVIYFDVRWCLNTINHDGHNSIGKHFDMGLLIVIYLLTIITLTCSFIIKLSSLFVFPFHCSHGVHFNQSNRLFQQKSSKDLLKPLWNHMSYFTLIFKSSSRATEVIISLFNLYKVLLIFFINTKGEHSCVLLCNCWNQ